MPSTTRNPAKAPRSMEPLARAWYQHRMYEDLSAILLFKAAGDHDGLDLPPTAFVADRLATAEADVVRCAAAAIKDLGVVDIDTVKTGAVRTETQRRMLVAWANAIFGDHTPTTAMVKELRQGLKLGTIWRP